MLHNDPRHVSNFNMPIFRKTNFFITASGIVILCKRLYSIPDESRLLYVCYITILDMFRALTCPSSGGHTVLSQHLVLSLSVNGCTVCRLRADCLLSTGILYIPYILDYNPHPFYIFIHTYRTYCTYRIFWNLICTLFTVSEG
jgi:hypothetical protein